MKLKQLSAGLLAAGHEHIYVTADAGNDKKIKALQDALLACLREYRDHAKKYAGTEANAEAREDWEIVCKRMRACINGIAVAILASTEKQAPEIDSHFVAVAVKYLYTTVQQVFAEQPGVEASTARALKVTNKQLSADVSSLVHGKDYRELIADIDYIAGKIAALQQHVERVAYESR